MNIKNYAELCFTACTCAPATAANIFKVRKLNSLRNWKEHFRSNVSFLQLNFFITSSVSGIANVFVIPEVAKVQSTELRWREIDLTAAALHEF
jgi:hypothetical protein